MREKLQTLPLTQLRELAKAQGLKGVTTLKKAEIIDRLCEIAGGKAADKDLAGMDAAGAEGGGVHNIIPSEPLAAAEEKKTDEKPSETIDKEPRILKKNTREEKRRDVIRTVTGTTAVNVIISREATTSSAAITSPGVTTSSAAITSPGETTSSAVIISPGETTSSAARASPGETTSSAARASPEVITSREPRIRRGVSISPEMKRERRISRSLTAVSKRMEFWRLCRTALDLSGVKISFPVRMMSMWLRRKSDGLT